MYVVVGLGNTGKQYENTRHNVGFNVIDILAKEYDISVTKIKHKALIGEGRIGSEKVLLVKPQTYMNLSGESVRELIDYYKADETQELIVIYDDISLPPGQLRIRKKGSAGGHNGIKNIISHLGHDTFMRIKVGVGEKPQGYDLAAYVLGHFDQKDQEVMQQAFADAADAVVMMMNDSADAAMNHFNGKKQ